MISVALGWLLCPLFGALPYICIAKVLIAKGFVSSALVSMANPLNAIFEAFSGFTSSGLTMITKTSELPHILQWLRSFQQWVGGVGLIIFVLSLIEPNTEEFQLYFVETKSKGYKKSILKTTRSIIIIYSFFTIIGLLLFLIAGMPLWQAINHSLSAISTGGFTITDDSFKGYSIIIKCISIFIVILGAMSFSVHYKIFVQKKILEFWKNIQTRVFYLLLIIGSGFLILINYQNLKYLEYIFQWVSSLATCGFHTTNIAKFTLATKLLMIFAMIIGGCSGSTVGGLKIRRIIFLFQAIILRIRSLTISREKKVLKRKDTSKNIEPSGVSVPESHKTERLYEASVLFFLWILTLFIGVFLLILLEPENRIIDVFFDVTSAMSNVGLTTGVTTATMHLSSKIVMIFLMWIGRLEIIPILVLSLSFFYSLSKRITQKK